MKRKPRSLRVLSLEDRSLPSSVQGTIFDDANRNQIFDPGETGLSGWAVYVDNNRDGIQNPGEVSAVTDANGEYFIDTTSVVPNNGWNYFNLDLQAGSGGRWLFTSSPEVWANPTEEPSAARDFGVHFEPYVSVEPDGPETLINTTVTGTQDLGEKNSRWLASDAAGNYVVVWGTPATATTKTVLARMFAADGTPTTGEISVASMSMNGTYGIGPEVAMADNGRFVVAWSGYVPNHSGWSTFMRVYSSTGSPLTSTITVAAAAKNNSGVFTGVSMDADGDFAVLYHNARPNGQKLMVQRFTSAGAANGKAIEAASLALMNGNHYISMDGAGRFVVTWDDAFAVNNATVLRVFAQRFSATGQKVGTPITVAEAPNPGIYLSSTSMNDAGRFVVSWCSYFGDQFMAQVFDWGTPVGGPVMVNQPGSPMIGSGGWTSASDIDSAGNVTFAWIHGCGTYSPGAREILFRRLTADGTLEPEYVVNTTTQGNQGAPALAATGNDRFVVAWQGYGPGDDAGVFAQRFALPVAPRPGFVAFDYFDVPDDRDPWE